MRESGPFGASSNEIARRAGVSWGVIQHHFGSRAGILLAMIEDGFGALLDELDTDPIEGDPLAAVVDAVWRYCTLPDYLLYTDVLRVLARDPSSAETVRQLLRDSETQLNRSLVKLLRPTIPSDAALRIVGSLIFATMRGLGLRQAFDEHATDTTAERTFLVRALHLALDADEGMRA